MNYFTRMSITRQFVLLTCLGVILAIGGMAIALSLSYRQAISDRQAEVQRITEIGVAMVESFVQEADTGVLSIAQAQDQALRALSTIRYDGKNYYFVLNDQSIILAHPNKTLVGISASNIKDPFGTLIFEPMIIAADRGAVYFHHYYFARVPGGMPEPKIAIAMAVPQWHWVIGTGLYVDDLNAELMRNVIQLAEIFIPLLLGIMLLSFVICKAIAELVKSMSKTMRDLADGDMNVIIAGQDRDDEIGAMADALIIFKENAQKKFILEEQAAQFQKDLDAKLKGLEAQFLSAGEEQKKMVASLSQGLEKIARGDLTFRFVEWFPVEFKKLRMDYNQACETLRMIMRSVTESTKSMHASAEEISAASDDLSRRTEKQAASLAKTAASLDEITNMVRNTAAAALEARQVAGAAKSDAEQSSSVVHDAVDAMHGIEDSSKQISHIIGVINDIAFQTNLLALNAGVEAARAGDAGRGFAVVATEVRALAQRTADAAKEIKSIISTSGQQVGNGVRLVGEAGDALTRIIDYVARLNSLISGIATSVHDQASGLVHINEAVGLMDKVTQENAAMVEQTTSSSHNLAESAATLAQRISAFKVGDATGPQPPLPQNIGIKTGNRTAMEHAG